jgi:hypothetical protein
MFGDKQPTPQDQMVKRINSHMEELATLTDTLTQMLVSIETRIAGRREESHDLTLASLYPLVCS